MAVSSGEESRDPRRTDMSDEQRSSIHRSAAAFAQAPCDRLRRRIALLFYGVAIALIVVLALAGAPWPATAMALFVLLCAVSDLAVRCASGRTPLYQGVVRWLRHATMQQRMVLLAAACLALLAVVGLFTAVLAMVAVAAALALGLQMTLGARGDRERRDALREAQQVLHDLGQAGVDAATARTLVFARAGDRWTAFLEALFGFGAVDEARRAGVLSPPRGPAGWTGRVRAHVLSRLGAAAERRAAGPATDIVRRTPAPGSVLAPAAQTPPPAPRSAPAPATPAGPAQATPQGAAQDRAAATADAQPHAVEPQTVRVPRERRRRIGRWLAVPIGRPVRCLAGVVLVLACALWMRQNDLLPSVAAVDLSSLLGEMQTSMDADPTSKKSPDAAKQQTQPLQLNLFPQGLTRWVDGPHVGLAGLILLVSSFFAGPVVGLGAMAAAWVAARGSMPWLGRLGPLPAVPSASITALAISAAGLVIQVLLDGRSGRSPLLRASAGSELGLLDARGQLLHAKIRGRNSEAQALRFARSVLAAALGARASDIHLEQKPAGGSVRCRVDGSMVDLARIDDDLLRRVQNVVKILCELDITRQRTVQEGHFSVAIGTREVDCRVSLVPAVAGQNMVIRLLDSAAVPRRTDQLLLPDRMLQEVRSFSAMQSGMMLVCGPTGSGKTTTLYAVMRDMDVRQRHAITIEDPVEYRIAGATQMPVDEARGATFDALLRSALRQDPDVILVGEIRDSQTAGTAARAALTGHLVLSTLHASDAAGALLRLLDLGVGADELAASLRLVVVQRLARRLCTHCRAATAPDDAQRRWLADRGVQTEKIYEPRGCRRCLQRGTSGRRALFEMLLLDDQVRRLITESPTAHALRKSLGEASFMSMDRMAAAVVAAGEASFAEVASCCGGV
jgi:general secretion pathway protein E